MSRYCKSRRVNRKVFALVLAAFLLPNPVFATQKDVFAAEEIAKTKPQPEKIVPTDVSSVSLPEDIGLVKEKFEGNAGKLIIHIQDAHCNYEAQNNLAKILEHFMDERGLVLVTLEGSAGEIDTSLFKTFPDEQIRKEVSDYFMKKGKISGAEFLAINTDKPIILFGIENKDYYLENLKAFTDTLEKRASALEFCNNTRDYLEKLKRYIYDKKLKELDKKISDYNSDKIKFVDFCVYLKDLAAQKGLDLGKYKNFSSLLASLDIEKKIDFGKVDEERSLIIAELEKKLSQDDLSNLFMQSLSYKTKKITSNEYYSYLKDTAVKVKLDLGKLLNFRLYLDYIANYGSINNMELFREMAGLEEEVKESLYANDNQRTLNRLSKDIRIIKSILDISLSKDEALYFIDHEKEFNSTAFTDFIARQSSKFGLGYSVGPDAKVIDELIPVMKNFYKVAEKREDSLLENTLNKMQEKKFQIAVLISGGFHTEGLMKRLRDRGISYVVISPRIKDLDAESPYLEVLSGGKITTGESVSSNEKKE